MALGAPAVLSCVHSDRASISLTAATSGVALMGRPQPQLIASFKVVRKQNDYVTILLKVEKVIVSKNLLNRSSEKSCPFFLKASAFGRKERQYCSELKDLKRLSLCK